MGEWLSRQEQYMSILLEQEVPPYVNHLCPCGSGKLASFRCNNCHGSASYCAGCMVQQHQFMPFHRIKRWNGFFLQDSSLSDLGLVVHFGHAGYTCPSTSAVHPLLVLHIDGFHHISGSFCECNTADTQDIQLFRFKLFPATIHSPKSAFTFEVLEQFRLHHLEGKVSSYIYIQSLHRLTNDEGSSELPVSRSTCVAISSYPLIEPAA